MKDLENFLNVAKIDYDKSVDELERNSEDTSLFKILPKIIIYPKSKNDISLLLKFISKNKKYTLTGRSGGTDMSGGPLNNSIILSFTKYFNKIISINKENKISQVEPGVFYRDFERETLKQNLILPSYPASREICALGGMIANNSGGEKSLIYGKTQNYVEELECVLSNGEIVDFKSIDISDLEKDILNTVNQDFKNTLEYKIYKEIYSLVTDEKNREIIKRNTPIVSKNSAGYYLWDMLRDIEEKNIFNISKLIVGSQGTLAILSKIKLRLIEPKKYSKMLLIFIKDLKCLGEVRDVVLKYNPESFESYDDHTFRVAIKFLPSLLAQIFSRNKNKATNKEKNKNSNFNILKLGFSFWKELKLILFFGMPKLFLIAEFTGSDEGEILDRVAICERELKNDFSKSETRIETEFIKTDFEAEKYWTIRRESFNLLRNKVKGFHTAPFIDDIIVRGERLGEFLEELTPILDKYKLLYTVAGHVGDGNLHIIPLMNFDDKKVKEENLDVIKNCSREVYSLVKRYHGSITAEHNDGLIRTPFLSDMFDREMLELFKKVKIIFDQDNILNPGKKVILNSDLNSELSSNIQFENNLNFVKFK